MTIIIVFSLLLIKHFLVDFILQTKWQATNKGTYGHPAGTLHAVLHYMFTFVIVYGIFIHNPKLWPVPFELQLMSVGLGLLDGVLHYHIDWAKVNINKYYKLGTNNKYYWWLLGFDQLLHQLTYVFICWYIYPLV